MDGRHPGAGNCVRGQDPAYRPTHPPPPRPPCSLLRAVLPAAPRNRAGQGPSTGPQGVPGAGLEAAEVCRLTDQVAEAVADGVVGIELYAVRHVRLGHGGAGLERARRKGVVPHGLEAVRALHPVADDLRLALSLDVVRVRIRALPDDAAEVRRAVG